MALPDLTDSLFVNSDMIAAQARAFRAAGVRATHITSDDFALLLPGVLAGLDYRERSDVDKILARVNALRPPPRARRPGGAPPLPEAEVRRELEEALARLASQNRPTFETIASAHEPHLTLRGLRKRLERYPHLRDLIPR